MPIIRMRWSRTCARRSRTEHRMAAVPAPPAARVPAAARRPLLDRLEHRARSRRGACASLDAGALRRGAARRRAPRYSAASSSRRRWRAFRCSCKYALDYVRPRAVLLGRRRACGASARRARVESGLLDCAALAEALAPRRGDAELLGEPRLLRRYERWRKSENLLAADGAGRLGAAVLRARIRSSRGCAAWVSGARRPGAGAEARARASAHSDSRVTCRRF